MMVLGSLYHRNPRSPRHRPRPSPVTPLRHRHHQRLLSGLMWKGRPSLKPLRPAFLSSPPVCRLRRRPSQTLRRHRRRRLSLRQTISLSPRLIATSYPLDKRTLFRPFAIWTTPPRSTQWKPAAPMEGEAYRLLRHLTGRTQHPSCHCTPQMMRRGRSVLHPSSSTPMADTRFMTTAPRLQPTHTRLALTFLPKTS